MIQSFSQDLFTMKIRTIAIILSIICINLANAQSFTNYTTDNGLPDNNVNGVAVDGSNIKWFATQAGVARFDGTTWTTYTTANGLIDNYINCIAVDVNDHVWAGTDLGISTYDGSSWTNYNISDGLVNDMVSYISSDDAGTIWIGTNGGLSAFNGTTFTNYTTGNGLPSDMISYIATGGGKIWIGTWLGGLVKFDGSGFTIMTTAQGLPDNNISCIALDNSGNKWVGSFMGVTLLDNNDQVVKTYTTADGLFNNYVKDLAIGSDQDVWAGIYADYLQDGALNWFNHTIWTTYKVEDGLVNPMVKRLATDQNDHVWIATGNGVSEFTKLSGGEEPGVADISVFPNPAENVISVTGVQQGVLVVLYNLYGQAVLQKTANSGKLDFDISKLPAGIYSLSLTENRNTFTQKVVIK